MLQGDSGGRIPRFVDLDLGSSLGWWAATVATYCPSRMVEHPKSKSTQPRFSTTRVTLYSAYRIMLALLGIGKSVIQIECHIN